MSIKLMSVVWEADLPSADKFLLLAIADSASDEGWCWPSTETLARKMSKTRRSVFNALATVEKYLEKHQREGRSTIYRLMVDRLPMLPPRTATNHNELVRTEGGEKISPVQKSHTGYAKTAPRTVKEPSIPQKTTSSSVARVKAHPVDSYVPELTPVMTEIIAKRGQPWADRELEKFKDYYRAHGKSMKDWNAAYRNWLRNGDERQKSNGAGSNNPDRNRGDGFDHIENGYLRVGLRAEAARRASGNGARGDGASGADAGAGTGSGSKVGNLAF